LAAKDLALTSLKSCLNWLNPAADLTTLLLGAGIEGQTK